MSDHAYTIPGRSVWVEHIPVRWLEPPMGVPPRGLIIFIPNLTGTKEKAARFLEELASKGFVALSFDPWLHGERGGGSPEQMAERVFAAFRQRMWPILGQTTLDMLRVIDWAVGVLGVEPPIRVVGLSMGGDVAVTAAGLDKRIGKVAAVVATPDWLRPGMHDASYPDKVVDQGRADSYAQYFYDRLNPLTHLSSYAHAPQINFYCGEKDSHVPAEAADRFREALQQHYPQAAQQVKVHLLAGLGHMDVRDPDRWWRQCCDWIVQ